MEEGLNGVGGSGVVWCRVCCDSLYVVVIVGRVCDYGVPMRIEKCVDSGSIACTLT